MFPNTVGYTWMKLVWRCKYPCKFYRDLCQLLSCGLYTWQSSKFSKSDFKQNVCSRSHDHALSHDFKSGQAMGINIVSTLYFPTPQRKVLQVICAISDEYNADLFVELITKCFKWLVEKHMEPGLGCLNTDTGKTGWQLGAACTRNDSWQVFVAHGGKKLHFSVLFLTEETQLGQIKISPPGAVLPDISNWDFVNGMPCWGWFA